MRLTDKMPCVQKAHGLDLFIYFAQWSSYFYHCHVFLLTLPLFDREFDKDRIQYYRIVESKAMNQSFLFHLCMHCFKRVFKLFLTQCIMKQIRSDHYHSYREMS